MVVRKGKGEVVHSEQQPETHSKSIHEPSSNEWRTQKPRAHDKPKPSHDKLNVSPNQLKVGDNVLLDATDAHIATYEPNGAIPLTVLSIFPYGTVEVIHLKFATFKVNCTHLKCYFEFNSRNEECKLLAPP
ncbi:hypothetical protein GOBAR_AA14839 [Gossypium barbadense]|uniref:Uncharacterized protein n=1 Tax=Gossypium barbadense TaxID=3634 RepID=A0A2P5XR38_GOSBA|nr:hypothetical protein GOBAR_AA14839 [Gossypium barbadense]